MDQWFFTGGNPMGKLWGLQHFKGVKFPPSKKKCEVSTGHSLNLFKMKAYCGVSNCTKISRKFFISTFNENTLSNKSSICIWLFFVLLVFIPVFHLHSEMIFNLRSYDINLLKSEWKKKRHVQKLAMNKKSTIFVLSPWNLVKMITQRGDHFHQLSWG